MERAAVLDLYERLVATNPKPTTKARTAHSKKKQSSK
jgi:hypothetical protein